MPVDYLHRHPDYPDLLRTLADAKGIAPDLIEKDYWIMHCLHGLTQQGYQFELKGGTSLSKGFGIIHRFSEDIDLRIAPPDEPKVFTGKNHVKPRHCDSRKVFYDQLATEIVIDGLVDIRRDAVFDDEKYRSGGIRLFYENQTTVSAGLKDGILLEVGFDQVAPNTKRDISSWALDFAEQRGMPIADNRARGIACYEPGFTLVEKLQAIATKYRRFLASGDMPRNFMRHYYDVYCLLVLPEIKAFIGSHDYQQHKAERFPKADYVIPLAKNEAFLLSDSSTRAHFAASYHQTRALYYQDQPDFETLLAQIAKVIHLL